MFRSVTFKLTMWYLAIVMVISLCFSFVVYHFAASELSSGLQHQTQRIVNRFPVFGNDPYIRPIDRDIASSSNHILWRLAYFNILVLIGAGAASYFLARRTLEPIEAAHERQKRFTADVSHELRTPLTSLKMGSEVALLDSKASKQELQAALTSNLEDATKMEVLINSLLRLTKLDDATMQQSFKQLPTNELVETALKQVDQTAAAKNIDLQSDSKSYSVDGDIDSLVQILVILLDNAIKYSAPRSTVTVATSKSGQTVKIAVSDHGQGIAAKELPHVFDRFYRADGSRAKSADTTAGYGLGLSIAKQIADKHQAVITLTSRLGKGTTATLELKAAAKN